MSSKKVRFSVRYLLISAIIFISGCSTIPSTIGHLEKEAPRLFLSTIPKPKGVFLVVHGLNLKPSALDQISASLAQRGFHSYRMTLSGHNQSIPETFDEKVWIADVRTAYAKLRSKFKTMPIFVAGYSLGGLLATRVVDSLPQDDLPRGMILIAPALSLRSFPEIASIFRLPPPWALAIPNFAPRPYRRYPHTPLFWYSNTLAIYREAQHLQHPQLLAQIPTLLLINPRDELISPSGIQAWLEANNTDSKWQVQKVRPMVSNPLLAEHLIIDPECLGPNEWARMQALITQFLENAAN